MEEFPPVLDELTKIGQQLEAMDKVLDEMKVPHTPGRVPRF
jgi:hypothetical protein